LRLEIIAILSGFVSPPETLPATSCDAISPGGELASADKPDLRLKAGRTPRPGFRAVTHSHIAGLVRFVCSGLQKAHPVKFAKTS
jgi:hypothetical protein